MTIDANDIAREHGPDGLRGQWDRAKTNDSAVPPGQSRFRDLKSFLGEYTPLSYAIEGVVRSGSLYTLTAKTGHGKTGLLVSTALAVATGNRDIIGRDVERGGVAFIAVENPDDLRMRMMVTAFRFNIDVGEVSNRIMILDRRMKPEELVDELTRLSVQRSFGVVIVDTLAALFDGKDINDAVQGGDFMRRLRPLTRLPGLPAVLVAAHPVKSAAADNLIPYGSGAILNEVDGNLTLWKSGGIASLHWQSKFRGLDFEQLAFKFDPCASPDVLDVKGRQVTIPVCVPTTDETVEDRAAAEGIRNIAVLKAIAANLKGTQRQWMAWAKASKGSLDRALKNVAQYKFIEKGADNRWRLTGKGKHEIGL